MAQAQGRSYTRAMSRQLGPRGRIPRAARVAGRLGPGVALLLGFPAHTEPVVEVSMTHSVDLSHAFGEETVYWPTEEGFVLERGPSGETPGGYYYEAHRFRSAEHGGTHLDAPIHFSAEGQSVEQIPLDRLAGPGVVIDVEKASAESPDYRVQVSDFTSWERQHGPIPDGALVLIRTGFGQHWPDRRLYLGTARRGPEAVGELHFPGLSAQAAR
ncbi:MAG: cyclase family protein [Myxococcota bacterium]